MRIIYKIVLVVFSCLSVAASTTSYRTSTVWPEQGTTSTVQLSFSGRADVSIPDAADKKRRDDILEVVNKNLSSESCKYAVLAQFGDGTQCLRDECVTLEQLKDLVSVVGCTSRDYDKLHAVICVASDPPCLSSSPSTSPQTTVYTEDQKRRDEILNVVNNNLSSEQCKSVMMTQLGDGKQCLRDGCATLEQLKDLVSVVGCTSGDYDKLHVVICVASDPPCTSSSLEPPTAVGGSTTKAPSISHEQAQMNQIRCTIKKKLSNKQCQSVVEGQTSEDYDLSGSCAKLESFANKISLVGCTQADYDTLHDVICTWDGTERCIDYAQKQKDAIAEIENGLSTSCNKSIFNNIRSANFTTYCANINKSKDILLSNKSCDASEIGNLTNMVCCNGSQCFEPGVDENTRKVQVTLTIRGLSPQCAQTMTVAIEEFSQPPNVACKALEATKSTLLNGGVCSEKDFASLSAVVCKSDGCDTAGGCTTVYDPYANEKPQRDTIQSVILHDVQEKCKNFMQDMASNDATDPLEKTCKTFLDNYGFIVIGEQCTEEDYNKLKLVICGTSNANAIAAKLTIGVIFVLVKTFL